MKRPAWLSDTNGSTIAEFALIIPLVIVFVFGIINLCLMMYTTTRLHWAAEEGARCASVRRDCKDTATHTTVDATNVQSWAQSHYSGGYAATFTCANSCVRTTCGYQVTGSATYNLRAMFFYKSFTLSSTACYP